MSTNIAWTDETWNPVRGCSRVSSGCEHCYAERVAHRNMGGHYAGLTRMTSRGPTWTGEIRLVPEKLDEPLRWRRPRRIFVNSMSDLFHEGVPDEDIGAVFGAMGDARRHTFQVLTKRPERMLRWFQWITQRDGPPRHEAAGEAHGCAHLLCDTMSKWEREQVRTVRHNAARAGMRSTLAEVEWRDRHPAPRLDPDHANPWEWPLPNVWLGVSVENQATADERIPLLLQTPAAVRFLSVEPLLEPVDLSKYMKQIDNTGDYVPDRLHWVIVGGESGPNSRPFHVDWAREIIDQCDKAGVPPFLKQLGSRPIASQHDCNVDGWHPSVRFVSRGDGFADVRGLPDRKGADPSEWPADLRRQEWPNSLGGAAR